MVISRPFEELIVIMSDLFCDIFNEKMFSLKNNDCLSKSTSLMVERFYQF